MWGILLSTYVKTLSPTEKEIDVLRLAGQGKGYKEMAKLLDVSVNTIKQRARSLFYKFNSAKLAEAVYKATKSGVIALLISISCHAAATHFSRPFDGDRQDDARIARRARGRKELDIADLTKFIEGAV